MTATQTTVLKRFTLAPVVKGLLIYNSLPEPFQLKTYAQMYQAFSHQGLKRGNDCWLTIEGECMRLKQAGQLTQDPAHFREQSEAWLAGVLGEEAAGFVVDRPRG